MGEVDKILDGLFDRGATAMFRDKVWDMQPGEVKQAKTALYDLIAREVIGEDTDPYPGGLLPSEKSQNRLRTEQRQALNKLFGKGKG